MFEGNLIIALPIVDCTVYKLSYRLIIACRYCQVLSQSYEKLCVN